MRREMRERREEKSGGKEMGKGRQLDTVYFGNRE
jgi:hypothetical protein